MMSLAQVCRSLLVVGLVACAAAPAPSPATRVKTEVPAATAVAKPAPPPVPLAPRGAAFGGERWGFAEASSADGRLVVLRTFEGDARPHFGHHGESATPTRLTVHDGVKGTERLVDDVIDVDPSRRWFLFVDGGAVLLADARSGGFDALTGALASADQNRCLAPRVAAFSPKGKRVAWLTTAGMRVRDLQSGQEWLVKGHGRVWRGWPDDETHGATLLEVAAAGDEWPRQQTSCACRWCGRFALSFGVYGWSGPSFDVVHVAEDGSRGKADPADADRKWHGTNDAGCTLEPKSSDDDELERGPWQWQCPRAPAPRR